MSWIEHHENSERLASQAQVAAREGRRDDALALYARAADAEDRALAELDPSKTRTLGISAVSAASLHYKANRLDRAEAVAVRWLDFDKLPAFAGAQLRSLLQTISIELPRDRAVARSAPVELAISLQSGVRYCVRPNLSAEKVKVVGDEQTAEAVKKEASRKRPRPRSRRKSARS